MSIYKILIKPGTPAVFDPNPLKICVNDSVFWFNSDPNEAHWPAPSAADPTGFIAYQIPPNTPSSQVSFGAPQTISYVCINKNHKGESGKIIVESCKKKGAFGGKTKKGAFGRTTR
jgi:plastocyanin